jgi:hypothetical protein
MSILDVTDFSLVSFWIELQPPCQTEMSFFGKFIRVLFFGVLNVSREYVFPNLIALCYT